MSISIGLYPKLDLWTTNKLHYITLQYVEGLTANNVRNKLADCVLTDAGAASWQMLKI
jgi:hypothetical protein